ncbi:MAG: SAM-dependent methyltransferase [Rhodobacteraceae bacterium]|nr:SAM-dependent methyltransferase [Paracoccaceae bacterium]
MRDLDTVASKYTKPSGVEIENDLILNWYPQRVLARTGRVGNLLELGLGHGYTVRHFHEMADRHTVIEGSRAVVDYFEKNNPWFEGRILEGYFETCELDERFDLIVMGFVLEHVDDPVAVMRRYRKALAPGGRLFVAVPNAKSMNRRLGLEMGLIDDIYDLNETDHLLGHQRNYCRETLAADAARAGYRVAHEEGIYLKPLPLGVLKTLDDMDANLKAMLKVGVDFPDLCVALLVELVPEETTCK